MQTHHTTTQRTAHYYTIGEAGKHIKRLWIVCHGYGQTSSRMIYKFEEINDGKTFIVAPEGLNRFYFKNQHVGATWMTSLDRLFEIEDYCVWLEKIYNLFVPQMGEDVEITLFGFSQGATTQMRFIHNRQIHFHNLILWAGDIPEDITYRHLKEYFSAKRMIFVYGDDDQFIKKEKVIHKTAFSKEQGFEYEIVKFEGKHQIDRPTLRKVFAMLL